MPPALPAAGLAWTVAVAATLIAVLLPRGHERISLALLALATALVLLGALVLAVLGPRRRRAERRRALQASRTALARLEYLPAVTTGTRRIRWRGDATRVKRAPGAAKVS